MITLDDRRAQGSTARSGTPRSAHAGWVRTASRRSPVDLLEEQDADREPDLVPVRHGRMMVSPFTFYRGAAKVMAEDLKDTPAAGLVVQLCGDAHLLNFGVYGSPERRLVFDVNDFDETLPGPFEYDVKRMATSFLVAGRDNGFSPAESRDAARASVTAYREAMAGFARLSTMDVWYASLDESAIASAIAAAPATKKNKQAKMTRQAAKEAQRLAEKAHTRDSLQALSKLGELVDGQYRIVSQPPVVVPGRDLAPDLSPERQGELIREQFRAYRASLQPDVRHLIGHFEVVDFARKVVGVGSVGTRAWIALLLGRDRQDPLFLQMKEAEASVLEEPLGPSEFSNHGERVVTGQRLMQATSDIFLGWLHVESGLDDKPRDFYARQLKDWKGSAEIEQMIPQAMAVYGKLCGWTLARAHARSGDRIAIASYLGRGDVFDRAIFDFSKAYAEQNERDYQALAAAAKSGRIKAETGL
jgi:uncharacterized protein (DUF2252 family)